MILKSFLLGNLVSLCMKIINSVVVVGLYYGFLTTFSIGPSYLFLLRAHVMEEGEEGTEKKVSATTGFITGQLLMFISIYYAPLHLALGRPHTITVLALPYLLFHFFWNNHKHFFDYGSTTRNSMRNLSIQCVFLNNLIFQLFNHFILPSSMLARLVNIFMFRCNSKMLFVTSSFLGWIIGHILFMKWIALGLVWIRQNRYIHKYIPSKKYLGKNYMARIFSIVLFIPCVSYLGRTPSPIFTKKLKKRLLREEKDRRLLSLLTEETEEREAKLDFQEPFDNNSQENFKFKKLAKNQKDEEKDFLGFENLIVTQFFDSRRWNRPLRYIRKKGKQDKGSLRKEASQYFFYTCQSDGKQRIAFTYPPSLSTFEEMIARRVSLCTLEKLSADQLYTKWLYTNKQKNNNLNNEFLNRIEALETVFLPVNILETKTRLCNAETENKNDCLVKMYDPFLNGVYRGKMKRLFSSEIINETSIGNDTETFEIIKETSIGNDTETSEIIKETSIGNDTETSKIIKETSIGNNTETSTPNQIHGILRPYQNSRKYEHKKKMDSNNRSDFLKIRNDPENQKKFIEIGKKVPRRPYKLVNEFQQFLKRRRDEKVIDQRKRILPEHQVRSRRARRLVISRYVKTERGKQILAEFALISYLYQSNYRRAMIKGAMRAQRRKTAVWKLFQVNARSPLFLEIMRIPPLFSFSISELMEVFFRNWVDKEPKLKYTKEQKAEFTKQIQEKRKKKTQVEVEILEAKAMTTWIRISHGRKLRTFLLIALAIFRRTIVLPSLIIAKNIARMLLLQFPEWSEDFQDWKREIYLVGTLNGLQFSSAQFPRTWLREGIQIKILYPFHLKPWHRSEVRPSDRDLMKKKEEDDFDYCFLTTWGMEADYPFGPPRKTRSFFKPIFKEIKEKISKLDFIVQRVLKEIPKVVVYISKEAKEFLKKAKEFLKEAKESLFVKPIRQVRKALLIFQSLKGKKFIPREIYESSETQTEKDSIISNQIIQDSLSQIGSTDWTNFLMAEEKMKNMIDRTSTIIHQIEIMAKDKKKVTPRTKTNPNKKNNNGESLQNIWQILKIKNIQLIVKLHFFFKIFIEKIYIEIFPSIINMLRISLIESRKKILDKSIYNTERNKERINKTKQNQISFISPTFISTIKKALYNLRNSKWKSHIFFELSYLSQAYVFLKLSQTQVIHLYKLRSLLQYNGPSFFLKTEIKDFFGSQEILHSELRHKKLPNFGMNEWKNWLRGHYEYDLSQITWSRLDPQKCRNGINQCHTSQNKDLNKRYSYEKDRLLDYKKKPNSKVYSLPNKEDNLKKNSQYDLLSYKYIHSATKKNSYIYKSSLEANKNQENSTRNKEKFFNILKNIRIKNYLGKSDMKKRKYFDWKIIHFFLREGVDIEAGIKTDHKHNTKIKVEPNKDQLIDTIKDQLIDPIKDQIIDPIKDQIIDPIKDQIIDKIKDQIIDNNNKNNNNDLFSLPIDANSNNKKNKKEFFDWMGMNEKIFDWMGMNETFLNCPIPKSSQKVFSLPEPEFRILYDEYKEKPWFIPSKLLLFNFNLNRNKNFSEIQTIISFRPSNEKDYFELKNQNNIAIFFSELANERRKAFFRHNYHFRLQVRWDDAVGDKPMNNARIGALLLKMRNPKKITLSYIRTQEMNLNLMVPHRKYVLLRELINTGVVILEATCLSRKNDGQFFMYQIIGISLVHKSKDESNQRYREQKNVAKNNFEESISEHKRKILNGDKKNYDLLVAENLLSSRRRREFRILISFNFNLKNRNDVHRNPVFCKENKIKNCSQVLDESKHFDRNKNELIKFKFLFWPNYRFEDLACMNRYWFDTNNGSRLSMLRIYMSP
uniref:Protein TIC 214 n=1 Tax=Doniophyton anomalum TaxID=41570 RepID=A0A7D5JBM1_9ASTR|nr:Ycf1 [Doniophyton anomalum]